MFYISKSTISIFIILLSLFVLIGAWYLVLIGVLIFAITLALFRKKKNDYYEEQLTTIGTIYSPISGKVVRASRAEDGSNVVAIKTGLFHPYGIYLPFTSKIENLVFNNDLKTSRFSTSLNPEKESGVVLELSDKKERKIQIQFVRFITGKLPELVILPGDRGRRQVNIGYFPFGGVTIIYLPEACELVAKVGDRVIATESILARIKEED